MGSVRYISGTLKHPTQEDADKASYRTHQTPEGWFCVVNDETEVGPFESEWEAVMYCEGRDIDANDDERNE